MQDKYRKKVQVPARNQTHTLTKEYNYVVTPDYKTKIVSGYLVKIDNK